jgi:DNA-binding transcriptional LysR family regulator
MPPAVRDGSLHIAALGLPAGERPHGVRQHEFDSHPHVAVVCGTHILAGKTEVLLGDLAEETFVDFPSGGAGRDQSDQAFAAAGLDRHVAFELMDPGLILRLVERDLAVALLPPGVVGHHPGVTTVPVRDAPRRVEYLVWSDFNPTPAARAFLATLPFPLG